MKKLKIKRFTIDIYDWDVALVETTGPKDWEIVKAELRKLKFPVSEMYDIKHNLTCRNGADHCFNTGTKKSTIILYSCTSNAKRINTLCHEKRHVEDRILETCHIDDLEAAAYLAGLLASKLLL